MSLNCCLGPTERGGWRGVGRKGWQRVGEGLSKGWRRCWQRVGEGLAKGWRRAGKGLADFLAPSNFGIPEALPDCVNSSPPLILRKFQGFGGIWANSGNFGKFRKNSGEFSGIQWGFVWRLV